MNYADGRGCNILKLIIAKVSVILAIIFLAISICDVSSTDCLKKLSPIQQTFIGSKGALQGIVYGDMKLLSNGQFIIFFISLLLIILSSSIGFKKMSKVKSSIIIAISIFLLFYVLITHNYVWFLMLFNIYLFLNVLFNCFQKDKITIFVILFSLSICLINILKLYQHLELELKPNINMQEFESLVIHSSKTILVCLLFWAFPYIMLVIRDGLFTFKKR